MIYYCSDIHWGHENIARLREFATEGWKRYVLDELASITRHDILFVLGDLAIDKRDMLAAIEALRDCPADIRFVWGNHDPGRPTSQHPNKRLFAAISEVASITGTALSRKIAGTRVLLSHFPYDSVPPQHDSGDEPDPANRLFRLHDQGLPLVHGHVHTSTLHLLPYTYNVTYEATGKLLTPECDIEAWLKTL